MKIEPRPHGATHKCCHLPRSDARPRVPARSYCCVCLPSRLLLCLWQAMFDAQAEVSKLEAEKSLLLSEIEGLKGGAHKMAAGQAEASRLAKLNVQLHSELETLEGKLQEALGAQAEASRLAKLNSHLHCELEALRGELQGASGLKAEASRLANLNSQLQSENDGLRAELQQVQESGRQVGWGDGEEGQKLVAVLGSCNEWSVTFFSSSTLVMCRSLVS